MKLNRMFSLLNTFVLAAAATLIVVTTAYGDASHPTQATMVLFLLLGILGFQSGRVWLSREVLLNLTFIGYQVFSFLWAVDVREATNTLPAITNSSVVLVFFSTLIRYHNLRAVLFGMFFGFMVGAALYTLTSGYPFTYPEDFSYNTIASMYIAGLLITLLLGAYLRLTVIPTAVSLVLLLLIAATTSIKSNLGIALGLIGAGILYFRFSLLGMFKMLALLAVFGGALTYAVMSNPDLTDRVQGGLERVSTGVAVLTNREGDSAGIGLSTRQGWQREGVRGWIANPLFGSGMEAFRSDFGITSHSTPIDLLYNYGIVGFGLFYALFASILWRLYTARNPPYRPVRARIMLFLITYSFISVSGIVYYDQFFYIFVALSSGLLVRLDGSEARQASIGARAARGDLEIAARA